MDINMKWITRAAWLIVIAAASGVSAQAAVVHRVVVARGNAAPGGGTFSFNLGVPQLNSSGQVAFLALINGGPSDRGIFLYDGPTGTAIVLNGTAAPGGGTYSSLTDEYPLLNSSGQVAYDADLDLSDFGIFRHDGITGVAIARAFTPTPVGGFYSGLSYPHLNSDGEVAYRAHLAGASSLLGIFRHDGTTGVAIALDGAAAPAGGNYSGLNHVFDMNSSGQVVFDTSLTGGTSTEGIFRLDGVTGDAIALRGAPAPGGGNFSNLGSPLINSSGHVAYSAALESAGFDPVGVYLYRGETGSVAIALPGDPAPDGGNYESGVLRDLNSSGQVAYSARITGGTHSEGIFRHDDATATTIALQNTAAPGTMATFFSEFSSYDVRMNDAGIVVFRAELIGAGMTGANNNGFWYGTSASDLKLLVRGGDTMFVNGQNRTLDALPEIDAFSLSETGIAWFATFTDNTSAIIHSTFAAAPGDFDGSGGVDGADFLLWQRALGSTGPDLAADGNGDGLVDGEDLALWRDHFGEPNPDGPMAAGVPEPGALAMASIVIVGLLAAGGSRGRRLSHLQPSV